MSNSRRAAQHVEAESFMGKLPPEVRPHKIPTAVAVGVESGVDGKVIAVQVFCALGVVILHFSPDEWDSINAQVQAKMPEARSSLVIPGSGVPLLGLPLDQGDG